MERERNSHKKVQEIRNRHKRQRDAMTAEAAEQAGKQICERLLAEAWYRETVWIYGYYPLGREVDCRPFLAQARADGKRVALPRTFAANGAADECRMEFYEIASLEQVTEGRFHVLEPAAECRLVQEAEAVVLVPGVVFDIHGNRYGYGKGYYDRYFARFPGLYKLALGYEHQIETELITKKTDVRMDAIYTEQQCYLLTERMGKRDGIAGNL